LTFLHIWIVYRSDSYDDDNGVGDYEGSDGYDGEAGEDDERM